MGIFESEQELQEWLSGKFKEGLALADITSNYSDYTEDSKVLGKSPIHRKIQDSFKHCLKSFCINEVITESADISQNPKDRLIPDFIIFAPETQSIVIIELKNLKGPSRQAGTELGAYAAEVRTLLPYLSEGDLVNVVVSTEWPTLLRHYVFNEIIWLQRKVICLQPVSNQDGIELKIIEPSSVVDTQIDSFISSRQLGGYQLCLYDDELYNGGKYHRMETHENQMRAALHAMAAQGNLLRVHGFAFLWRHVFEVGLSPYNITILNFAPFQISDPSDTSERQNQNVFAQRLMDIVRDYDPEGHGNALDTTTNAAIRILSNICRPQAEGYHSWEYLKPLIFKNTDAIAFVGWGYFGERYFEHLAKEYHDSEFEFDHDPMSPLLGIQMLNEIII